MMMRKAPLAITAPVALLLAACGTETSGTFTTEEGETGEYTVDRDSGEFSITAETEDGTATLRSGADIPLDLPDGFVLDPGASVVANTVFEQGEEGGMMVTFSSTSAPEEVAAFHKKQAEEAGFSIKSEMRMDTMLMIAGERESDGMSLSVTAAPDDGGTTGQLVIGRS